jgi:hypothetical protein
MIAHCLFCTASGPFSTIEHIIPESLGNDDLLLKGQVCDKCQAYFGKEVEKYVLEKTPIGTWRTLLGIRTKRGRLPSVDLSVPEPSRGVLPEYSSHHDNLMGFTSPEDGSTSVEIGDAEAIRKILCGDKKELRFVLSPKHLVQLGRFLGKIAIELYCLADPIRARQPRYDALRQYARSGLTKDIWPLFHSTVGTLQGLRQTESDAGGVLERVLYYEYALAEGPGGFELFVFRIGTDQWTICTNDPFPTPLIRDAFPDRELTLIWYSREEWQRVSVRPVV